MEGAPVAGEKGAEGLKWGGGGLSGVPSPLPSRVPALCEGSSVLGEGGGGGVGRGGSPESGTRISISETLIKV